MNDKSLFETIFKWIVVAVLFIVAVKVAFTILGITAVLLSLVLRLLPFILGAMLVMWVVRSMRNGRNGPTDDLGTSEL